MCCVGLDIDRSVEQAPRQIAKYVNDREEKQILVCSIRNISSVARTVCVCGLGCC